MSFYRFGTCCKTQFHYHAHMAMPLSYSGNISQNIWCSAWARSGRRSHSILHLSYTNPGSATTHKRCVVL